MYDLNFKNQAVKECVNGQSLRGTARKYGISDTALRSWVAEYKERMADMQSESTEDSVENIEQEAEELGIIVKDSIVKLKSVNINIDGYDVTMSKKDTIKLMEIFYQFDKQGGNRDDN